jgi:hypothetical protein
LASAAPPPPAAFCKPAAARRRRLRPRRWPPAPSLCPMTPAPAPAPSGRGHLKRSRRYWKRRPPRRSLMIACQETQPAPQQRPPLASRSRHRAALAMRATSPAADRSWQQAGGGRRWRTWTSSRRRSRGRARRRRRHCLRARHPLQEPGWRQGAPAAPPRRSRGSWRRAAASCSTASILVGRPLLGSSATGLSCQLGTAAPTGCDKASVPRHAAHACSPRSPQAVPRCH